MTIEGPPAHPGYTHKCMHTHILLATVFTKSTRVKTEIGNSHGERENSNVAARHEIISSLLIRCKN